MPLKTETAKGAKKAEEEFLEIKKVKISCRSEASGTIDWMKHVHSRRMLRSYRIAPAENYKPRKDAKQHEEDEINHKVSTPGVHPQG